MMLTDGEFELMSHTLGAENGVIPKIPWRNHFNTTEDSEDFAVWTSLVEKGFATRVGPIEVYGGSYNFYVTEQGIQALASKNPSSILSPENEPCSACNGAGQVMSTCGKLYQFDEPVECSTCKGTGLRGET